MKSKASLSLTYIFSEACFLLVIYGLRLVANWSPYYTSGEVTASNQVQLCYIKTSPDNITLYTSNALIDFEQSHLYGIKEAFSHSGLENGIFLDGDTCSQLKSKHKNVIHPRPIMQIISLKKF